MLTQDNCSLKLQLKIFSIQIISRTKIAIITAAALSFQAALKCLINSYLTSNQTKPIKKPVVAHCFKRRLSLAVVILQNLTKLQLIIYICRKKEIIKRQTQGCFKVIQTNFVKLI